MGALPRFYEEFGDPPSSDEEGEEEEGAPKAKRRRQADSISGGPSKGKQRRRQRKRRLRRDAEWEHLLGGNADDCFKLGISLSRRAVKLYSGFYDSDIVVASPLGLHMITGAPDAKSRDTDFLSSIEGMRPPGNSPGTVSRPLLPPRSGHRPAWRRAADAELGGGDGRAGDAEPDAREGARLPYA